MMLASGTQCVRSTLPRIRVTMCLGFSSAPRFFVTVQLPQRKLGRWYRVLSPTIDVRIDSVGEQLELLYTHLQLSKAHICSVRQAKKCHVS